MSDIIQYPNELLLSEITNDKTRFKLFSYFLVATLNDLNSDVFAPQIELQNTEVIFSGNGHFQKIYVHSYPLLSVCQMKVV